MLSQEFVQLGWYFHYKTDCWHLIVKTGTETGTGFDLTEDNTLFRYDWFISSQGMELVETIMPNIDLDYLYDLSKRLVLHRHIEW